MRLQRPQAGRRSGGARLPRLKASIIGYPGLGLAAQHRTGQQQESAFHDLTWFAHQDGTYLELARLSLFQNASRLRDATGFRHQDGDRTKRAGQVSFLANRAAAHQRQGVIYQSASAFVWGWRGRYQDAVPPPPGISVWVIPEPPAPQPCYTPSTHLLFAALAPADSHLLFVCENHIDRHLRWGAGGRSRSEGVFRDQQRDPAPAADGLPVPVFSLSLALDAASWTWGFDALLPAAAEALVAPEATAARSNW